MAQPVIARSRPSSDRIRSRRARGASDGWLARTARVTEPSPTSSKPAATRSRNPSRGAVSPSVSTTAVPARPDAIRSPPAMAVDTPKSPATAGRIGVSTRKPAWAANTARKRIGAGCGRVRNAMRGPYERTARAPSATPPNLGSTCSAIHAEREAQPACEKRAAAAARAALPETRSFAYTLER
jgi:hypothetical protein